MWGLLIPLDRGMSFWIHLLCSQDWLTGKGTDLRLHFLTRCGCSLLDTDLPEKPEHRDLPKHACSGKRQKRAPADTQRPGMGYLLPNEFKRRSLFPAQQWMPPGSSPASTVWARRVHHRSQRPGLPLLWGLQGLHSKWLSELYLSLNSKRPAHPPTPAPTVCVYLTTKPHPGPSSPRFQGCWQPALPVNKGDYKHAGTTVYIFPQWEMQLRLVS